MSGYAVKKDGERIIAYRAVDNSDPQSDENPHGIAIDEFFLAFDEIDIQPIPEESLSGLAMAARAERDLILRNVYDIGIIMAQRMLRIASSDADKNYANDKISELDAYAELLQNIPNQPDFPLAIIWPNAPTK